MSLVRRGLTLDLSSKDRFPDINSLWCCCIYLTWGKNIAPQDVSNILSHNFTLFRDFTSLPSLTKHTPTEKAWWWHRASDYFTIIGFRIEEVSTVVLWMVQGTVGPGRLVGGEKWSRVPINWIEFRNNLWTTPHILASTKAVTWMVCSTL